MATAKLLAATIATFYQRSELTACELDWKYENSECSGVNGSERCETKRHVTSEAKYERSNEDLG